VEGRDQRVIGEGVDDADSPARKGKPVSGQVTAAIDASALSRFRDGFAGRVALPEDSGYDAARAVWNGMIDRRPAIVVRPTGVADVLSALRFAREQELVIAVRSGATASQGSRRATAGSSSTWPNWEASAWIRSVVWRG
jgi:hypothetical protein